jgi:hypothetical protein
MYPNLTLCFSCCLWLCCCRPAGFCELGISWQSLENEGMREVLDMPKGLTGVYITKTEPLFDASRWVRSPDGRQVFAGRVLIFAADAFLVSCGLLMADGA